MLLGAVGFMLGTGGSALVASFHYGAGNTNELKSLLRKSGVLLAITSVSMVVFAEVMARPLALILPATTKACWI